ncbi:MAG: response regulator [Cyanobacteriota bacterium]|nr:response regulator [Cyanobacteriota bacterium]
MNAIAPTEAPMVPNSSASSSSASGDILIVDDEPKNLRVLSTLLSDRGYRVRQALDGPTALKAARVARPDLILLDVLMPGMGGYEVCQELKRDPLVCEIPIIFLSALDRAQDKVKGFEVGGVDYITKPFHIEEALARIDRQLTICFLQQQLLHKNKELEAKNECLQAEIAERQRIEKQLSSALDNLKRTHLELAQAEKMSSLGQLAAGVAHEINNPLNFIYANLDYVTEYSQVLLRVLELYDKHCPQPPAELQALAREAELDFLVQDFPKVLQSMRVGAERIQELVESMSHFARIDSSQMQETDLHSTLESALLVLQTRLREQANRVAIAVQRKYETLPLVRTYPGQLNQVLVNILSNAIDALEEKLAVPELGFSPEIEIATSVVDNDEAVNARSSSPERESKTLAQPQKWVEIRICDNGDGIPPQIKDYLFDHFFTTKPVGKGTGLGLSIGYSIIVDRHQGQLRYDSTPGKGTCFLIRLPL